jgi:hypothetical protein
LKTCSPPPCANGALLASCEASARRFPMNALAKCWRTPAPLTKPSRPWRPSVRAVCAIVNPWRSRPAAFTPFLGLLREMRRMIRWDRDTPNGPARTQLNICADFAHRRQQNGKRLPYNTPMHWVRLLIGAVIADAGLIVASRCPSVRSRFSLGKPVVIAHCRGRFKSQWIRVGLLHDNRKFSLAMVAGDYCLGTGLGLLCACSRVSGGAYN